MNLSGYTSGITQSPSAKSHTNGQYAGGPWTSRPMTPYGPQHHQPQVRVIFKLKCIASVLLLHACDMVVDWRIVYSTINYNYIPSAVKCT